MLLTCCLAKALILLDLLDLCEGKQKITLATYNVWNMMFNWEVRQLGIAQMIRDADPDVVALQEVRSSRTDASVNQVAELNDILGHFKYRAYSEADQVSPPEKLYKAGWEMEGIGLLSKHKIISQEVKHLCYHRGPDTNQRVILHAQLDYNAQVINVIVVHMSYDRTRQCGNAEEILNYIEGNKLERVVVLGDFNVYGGFEWPLHVLTGENFGADKTCPGHRAPRSRKIFLKDVWKSLYPGDEGLTFSNMPEPGMQSRPDRVLISQDLQPVSAQVTGDGSVYKALFFYHVVWNRFMLYLAAVDDANQGQRGRSCYHDCGPHASCRCGICVSGGDKNRCYLPDCEECSPQVKVHMNLFIVIFLGIVAQLLYSVLRVMHTIAMIRPGTNPEFLCFGKCCLCNAELYRPVIGGIVNPARQHRLIRLLTKLWPVLKLPPMALVFVTVLMLGLYCEIVYLYFDSVWRDVYSIIPEELFPSDHLMLVVDLEL